MKWFERADFAVSPAARILCFASPAVTPAVADGAAPGGASPAPAAGGGTPASPADGGTPGASPAPASSSNDANLRTLRENYEAFNKLGKLDEVSAAVQGFRALADQTRQLAEQLGYSPESVQAAFARDPYAVLQRLQAEQIQARANQPGDPNPAKDPESLINEKLAPITEHIARQQATVAAGKYDTSFNELFSNHPEFKGASDVPADVRQVVYDMVSESFKYDREGMQALLREGKTSSVQKAFDGVMERFLKTVNAYTQWKTARSGQPAAPAAPGVRPKLSLDDIIAGNDKATAAIPSLRH